MQCFSKMDILRSSLAKSLMCLIRQVNEQLNVKSTKRDIDFKCMFKVLYVGLVSHEFKTKVINWFFHDLGVEIFPIFKSCKLSGLFFLKSQTPKKLIANAVYKYICLCDTSLPILCCNTKTFSL